MVSVGSLVKLKCKTLSTIFDSQKGLIDCWLENQTPGIVVSVADEIPVPVCDIMFGEQVYYGIMCGDVEKLGG